MTAETCFNAFIIYFGKLRTYSSYFIDGLKKLKSQKLEKYVVISEYIGVGSSSLESEVISNRQIMKELMIIGMCFLSVCVHAWPGNGKHFEVQSPDGELSVQIVVDDKLAYSIHFQGKEILALSPIGMEMTDGTAWGKSPQVQDTQRRQVDQSIASPFYRATNIKEQYNELLLRFKGNYAVTFRAYNDGIAYRFSYEKGKNMFVASETVDYHFPTDNEVMLPYVRAGKAGDYESQFFNSFENIYTKTNFSTLASGHLAFLPLVVTSPEGIRICLTESHLENYPGLYLTGGDGGNQLKGVFPAYPRMTTQGGHNMLQQIVEEREAYIAKVDGARDFPWRIVLVAANDKTLAASHLTYLLGAPSRIEDTSWIYPGKVAWEWWNDYHLQRVDFKTGCNDATYKAYIDFASKHGIEYVILDEGWAVNLKADLMQVIDEIHLKELVDYAADRGVGIILWVGYYAFDRDMENICRHYSEMGVKGFKIDFMDRDDQYMTEFHYRAADIAARYHLLIDFHGTYKPAGLNRTYPNVLNFEGVHGLEQMKWTPDSVDQVTYDVQLPFIRQVAGPMDYTPGAMRNAAKGNFYPCHSEPMSQGTRCHQLALYVVLDAPLSMLCDSPYLYEQEEECTDFIASVPTVWDETVILDGRLGEYILTARRKGAAWYIGGISGWQGLQTTLDLSFLGEGAFLAELWQDGMNADRFASDYKKTSRDVSRHTKLPLRLMPGGGFVARIIPKDRQNLNVR